MSFDTYSFLFFFLPAVMLVYFSIEAVGRLMLRNEKGVAASVNPLLPMQNMLLLAASLFFYAWGEPWYVLLLIIASMVAYGGGILMDSLKQSNNLKAMRIVLVVTITLLVSSLGVFKYLGFFTENLSQVPSLHIPVVELSLPIGISFYTFQILSYVIDLYRGTVSVQRNPLRLLLYVSLFPQLIAGPIVRYQTVEHELTQRTPSVADIQEGTFRFIRGLAKKILVADNVARLSSAIYDVFGDAYAYDSAGTSALWLASLAYTLQIYFDFSGYSDMAIGLGRIFGFHFLENFNFPYISRSITEFWRRWHMSLSGWFRDYVYIPLGGSRCSRSRRAFNLLVVWALTGFWHGAAWNFILWGLYYGLLLMIEKAVMGKRLSEECRVKNEKTKLPFEDSHKLKEGKSNSSLFTLHSSLRWLYTFFIVNLGWVLFNLTDFSVLTSVLQRMFVYHPTDWLRLMAEDSDILLTIPYVFVGMFFSFPLLTFVAERKTVAMQVVRTVAATILLLLSLVYIVSSTFHPFIYFRF